MPGEQTTELERIEMGMPPAGQVIESDIQEQGRLQRIGRACGKRALQLTAIATLSVASGAVGSFLTPANTTIGPHEAEIQPTLNGTLTIDAGPLGSIKKPLDSRIGQRITVKEIPTQDTAGSSNFEFSDLGIEEYARFFTDPEKDVSAAKDAMMRHALTWALAGDGIGLGLYALVGSRRRRELVDNAKGHKLRLLAAASVGLTGFGIGTNAYAAPEPPPGDPIFIGTPLEGAVAEGQLLEVALNEYGAKAVDYFKGSQEFYNRLTDNLKLAFKQSPELLTPSEYTQTLLFYSDAHCNIGMAKVAGTAAKLYKTSWTLDAGDTTISGTELEEQCIKAFRFHQGGRKLTVAPGNHDSDITEQQERKHGYNVLGGKVVAINGLRILGDDDPRRSVIGQEIYYEHNETLPQMGVRLANIACSDKEGVDIMLVHDRTAGEEALKRGCAGAVLSGHSHNEKLSYVPNPAGELLPSYTGGSAGGAHNERPTVGPLQATATLAIFEVNKATGQLWRQQTIRLETDGSVAIDPPINLPATKFLEIFSDLSLHL